MTRGLLCDPGVLDEWPASTQPARFVEFGGFDVQRPGAMAILPWRGDYLAARGAGVTASPGAQDLPTASADICAVHVEKSRAATWAHLVEAWRVTRPGGTLLLEGPNALGIRGAARRLAAELGQPGETVALRQHRRVVRFERDDGPGPVSPPGDTFDMGFRGGAPSLTLVALPGVFSAGRLDRGSQLLLEHLTLACPPEHVLDVGCGAGPLGLYALGRWPGARGTFLDADARAVDSTRHNLVVSGFEARGEVRWWQVGEPLPVTPVDLVLCNPPFHRGKGVDIQVGRDMVAFCREVVAPGGSVWVVANRRLPYEEVLGRPTKVFEGEGYKVLELRS